MLRRRATLPSWLRTGIALLALLASGTAIAVAAITQQPQDVKAAVEWLPTNLANTPTTFTPLEVNFDSQINSGDAAFAADLSNGHHTIFSSVCTDSGIPHTRPPC